MLGPGCFLGEDCLRGRGIRRTSAAAVTECRLLRIERDVAVRRLGQVLPFCEALLTHLLIRTADCEASLSDQLLYPSEQRLARLLLRLCRLAARDGDQAVFSPKLTHEALAEMTGTTRSRVSSFMSKFRRLGLIEYDHALKVHMRRLAEFIGHEAGGLGCPPRAVRT